MSDTDIQHGAGLPHGPYGMGDSPDAEMTKGLEVQRKGMNSQEQWRAARHRLRELTPEPDELDYMTKVCEQIHYLLRLADTIIDRQAEQIKAKDEEIARASRAVAVLLCKMCESGLCFQGPSGPIGLVPLPDGRVYSVGGKVLLEVQQALKTSYKKKK